MSNNNNNNETAIPIEEMEGITPEYQRLMEKSNSVDFSWIVENNCFVQVGTDQEGVPVFLANASKFPNIDQLETLIIYIIKTLEPIVTGNRYSIVYSHALLKQESTPEKSWLNQIYQMLPRNYKKNLKNLYILHPSGWLKFLLLAMSPFLSEKFWNKVEYLDYIQEIPGILERNLIKSKLPEEVKEYDENLLETPEVTERVVTSMDTLGKEFLSTFSSSFGFFSSVDPSKWTSNPNSYQ
ncbi:hypothetical protein DICPUDRAFT_93698 [Dictyostelium purpureum]|uniref:CRAL-TRIO domain-containing protein n=1 Tax=Dictyostelium purpureum TaxID=5786 RepID=F0ZAM3_DICPU|nr:uncharacterized protein DICPUDRAFT_93698 [Dictyostelium purpureum]EGC39001.1 hypothetical protein DICPUDRAFT_93698 [Dictyostelium purpureum]|eukprot:XP_003284454.1 hypothetical protein DICPUDRAFT_93698 [Dictyostelium purpureum]